MWIVLTVLLTALPGAMGDDYNAGGLVGAATVSFLMLIPIVILIVIILKWRKWYMKRQARRGFYRVPRRHWTTFKKKVSKSKTTRLSHLSTPRSEHRQPNKTAEVVRTYDVRPVQQSDNRNILVNTTAVNRTLAAEGPAYATAYPEKGKFVVSRYEEKAQTIDLEDEEEPTFVADVLPDDHVARKTTVTQFMSMNRSESRPPPPSYDNVQLRRTTATQQPSLSQTTTRTEPYYAKPERNELRTTTVPTSVTQRISQNDYHVRLVTDDELSREHTPVHFGARSTTRSVDGRDKEPADQVSQFISQTIDGPAYVREEYEDETGMRTTVVRLGHPEQEAALGNLGKTYQGNEAYHATTGTRLSQTTRDGDIVITPNVPATNLGATTSERVTYTSAQASTSQPGDGDVHVMRFADSDDEAGNIPATHIGDTSTLY